MTTNAPAQQHPRTGFWALVATQFQATFNDNLFRWLIVFLLLGQIPSTVESGAADAADNHIIFATTLLFALPYVIFPGLAGAIGDRFSKRRVTIGVKYWEALIMALGIVGLWLSEAHFLWILLFLMAMQSAFFSPAKYGILPEILPEERLSWGNGIVQMALFTAIILGNAAAGPLYEWLEAGERVYWAGFVLLALSLGGLAAAHFISRPPAADPAHPIPLNPWKGLGPYLKVFAADRWILLAVLGTVYFWFAGTMAQQNLIKLARVLDWSATQTSGLAGALALGIGFGALCAGFMSRGKIEVGLVPLGAAGVALFGILLGWPWYGYGGAAVLLFGLGFFGGMYDVPLAATIQHRSPVHVKGGMIAAMNVFVFSGIILAAFLFRGLMAIGMTPQQVFLFIGATGLLVGAIICVLLPETILRFVLWILANTIYRVRVLGGENVPHKGGALLVPNHLSFVDALFISQSIDRPVRFIIAREFYELRWVRPVARIMHCIPISAMDPPRELVKAMNEARDALRNGEVLCVFAEGQISRTGQLLPFRKGFRSIVKSTGAPVIPVHLDQLWGSLFSFSGGRFFWKRPERIPYPVTVSYGPAVGADVSPFELRSRIQKLGTEAWKQRKLRDPLLHRSFIRHVRKHPLRMAMADANTEPLSYLKAYIATIIFGRKLNKLLGPEEMVGVLVPPTVGGALTNIALQLMGRVPVNLNYTASNDAIASAVERCGIKQVVTARKVFERLTHLDFPGEHIYLEDVRKTVSKGDRIVAMLLAVLCPVRLLERMLGAPSGRSQDDLATVIFSSGSEGAPKGVPLTHFNVMTNIEASMQVFRHDPDESMMSILPFFHSFGFTGTLWLPLKTGFSAVFHPTPLEAKAIGELMYTYQSTFLIAAPTFLQNFIRRCMPEELSSLKYVITGAEKLPAAMRESFRDKFGVEPLEGYGTTECAPVVSVNVPDFRAPGYFQKGTKHGTIGQPIPGVSVQVRDPDTGELLGVDEPGMLYVSGPNIMSGYLEDPERTEKVLQDGWYETGDIASIDDEGFIKITDRLARFSKIAGEMAPHTRIEEELHNVLGLDEQMLAVTGVPDAAKGERLVVLHTLDNEQLEELQNRLNETNLPNLWRPRKNSFFRVGEIPILGTGKLNLREVKAQAKEFVEAQGSS
jgi:acyl-[acyl-carrier-protein]-phospholipid O-acyltransferase/long-chain-fatty-acid--[acyl-carrier-protein] ligase